MRSESQVGDGYEVVEFKPTWGGVSILAFGLVLAFGSVVALLARTVTGFHFWAPIVLLVVPTLSGIGLILGLVGLRRAESKSSATIGTVLNLAVFLSAALARLLT